MNQRPILIIDNYDSFVFNLVRYIELLGYQTITVRNDQTTLKAIDQLQPLAIILSPGPCSPNEAGICLPLLHQRSSAFPMLGICLGHQAIGQAFGGKIVQAKQPMHGESSEIFHHQQGIFTTLPQPLSMGRYHSLVIEPESLTTTPLDIIAWSHHHEVMAIQHQSLPIIGLQFHPESILSPMGKTLLQRCLTAMFGG